MFAQHKTNRLYVTANLPAGSVTLELVSTAPSGSAWFSCPQLETGSIANHVNLLVNGDFARSTASGSRYFPTDWAVQNGVTSSALNGIVSKSASGMPDALSGQAARILALPYQGNQSMLQYINSAGKAGDVFVVGGWSSALSVASGSGNFEPKMVIRFEKGGTFLDCQFRKFSTARVGWQFGCWAVSAPGDYDRVLIGVCYERNAQTGMFSNLFVHREEFGQSFAYDANKNLVGVANLSTKKSDIQYDDADNVKSYRQPGAADAAKYTMSYGSTTAEHKKHLLKESVSPMGQRDVFTHDSYGNTLTSVRQKSGDAAFIKTESTYTANGNYKTTLLGVGDLEKRLGRKKFSEVLGKYIVKPQGAPTLVPETDPRKPYSDAAGDFIN